jgi:heterodisulfide reductase subunit B
MRFAYYPGCTATSTSVEYDESVRETSRCLGIELEEIPEWTCCGATSGHIMDRELSVALPSRNLALASRMSLAVVSPCPACSIRHKTAQYELERDPELKARVEDDIGMNLEILPKPKHILEVLYRDVGIDEIQAKVQKPLRGLKLAAYYGCFLVRPPEIAVFDDPENPTIMDEVMQALGAEIIDWSNKIDCCGGGLSIVAPEIVKKLVGRIVDSAKKAGADAVVTACGICQANLDMRQARGAGSHPLPIFYFSELSALAFGSSRVNGWLAKHLIDPSELLKRLRLL